MIRKIIKNLVKGKKIFIWLFITITTSAIIIMYSITNVTKIIILKDIQNMGADVFQLYPMIENKEGERTGFIADEDLIIIKRRCKHVRKIAMTIFSNNFGADIRIVEKNRKKELGGLVTVLGILPDYKEIMGLKLVGGRFINDLDIKKRRRVCVLGYYTYLRCGGKKCIGKSIEILGPIPLDNQGIPKGESSYLPERFTIIGALQRRFPLALPLTEFFTPGPSGFINQDTNMGVFVPYSTLKGIIKVEDDFKFIWIQMKMKEGEVVSKDEMIFNESQGTDLPKRLEKEGLEIINILKEKYGSDKKFFIHFAARLLDELEDQRKTVDKFLKIIVICTIIASIINILSLMLLSVNVRIGEIGIRRAAGARKKDIFWQFLREGLEICSAGIIGGILVGIIISYILVSKVLLEGFSIPIYGIILSCTVSFSVCILSSLYPALKAANIPPAQAVQYE